MFNRNISRNILDRVAERQGFLCAYCTLPFGAIVADRRGNERITSMVADHWIPWANGGLSLESNCVAACDVCNQFKGSNHYEDLQSASRGVLIKRMNAGYVTLFIPTISSVADYEEWQRQYSYWNANA